MSEIPEGWEKRSKTVLACAGGGTITYTRAKGGRRLKASVGGHNIATYYTLEAAVDAVEAVIKAERAG